MGRASAYAQGGERACLVDRLDVCRIPVVTASAVDQVVKWGPGRGIVEAHPAFHGWEFDGDCPRSLLIDGEKMFRMTGDGEKWFAHVHIFPWGVDWRCPFRGLRPYFTWYLDQVWDAIENSKPLSPPAPRASESSTR